MERIIKRKAFTLIELMVVVAIIGILAAISTSKFSDLLLKAREGATKGALSTLRSALVVYYADNTIYPTDDLASLVLDHKYLNQIPIAKIPTTDHPVTNMVTAGTSTATYITDAGGWAYISNRADNNWGVISVNCDHLDLRNAIWSTY